MRKLTPIVLGLNLALVSSTFAVQLEGNYLNGNIGIAMQPNITYHATNNSATTGNQYLATENKRGGALDLSYGYQTEDLRVEGSIIYLQNKIKKSLLRSTYFDINGTPDTGSTKVMGFMANGMYDFNSESDFTPYIGFGIGGVRITQDVKGFPSFNVTSATTNITATTCTTRNIVTTPGTTSIAVTSPPNTTTTTTTPTPVTTGTDTTTITTQTTVNSGSVSPSLPVGVTANNIGATVVTSTTAPTPTVPPPIGCGSPVSSTGSLPSLPIPNSSSYANSSQLQFAYQTIIGASYKLMDELKVSVDYRYLKALPTVFTVMDAGSKVPMRGSYSNHRFMLGLTAFL